VAAWRVGVGGVLSESASSSFFYYFDLITILRFYVYYSISIPDNPNIIAT
jgi:hypothetical protein